ncbi:MAG: hypothetical protein ACP5L4_06560 [Thermoplasmata archaeon]
MFNKSIKIFFIIIIAINTILIMQVFPLSHAYTPNELKEKNIAYFLSAQNNTSISNSNETIYYVEITSQFPGQPQMLTIPENGSGFFMYPYWTFRFFSDAGPGNLTTYTIYVNGLLLHSGSFSFTTSYSVNMSFNMVNVSIVLQSSKGVQIWNYHMIPILHTTMANYYKAQYTEKPIYTLSQYLEWGAKIFTATILILIGTYYTLIKTYIKRKSENVFNLMK